MKSKNLDNKLSLKVCVKSKVLKIVLICIPCNGFGDIIFCSKIYNYIQNWYPFAETKICTPLPKKFSSLLPPETKYIKLHSDSNYKKECRRLARFWISKKFESNHLYLFTPFIHSNYDESYTDIKEIFPTSNVSNTFFFSEYNPGKRIKIDFKTGIGAGTLGLLLTNPKKWEKTKLNKFLSSNGLEPRRYIFTWISSDEVNMSRSNNCLGKFIETVSVVNSKVKDLQILVPSWFIEEFEWNNSLLDFVYHKNIVLKKKNPKTKSVETIKYSPKNGKIDKVLVIRSDIFPVPHSEVEQLIMSSLDQVLVTGDQSLTDVISCCVTKKDIYYQIAPWKTDLANELAKEIPHIKFKADACFKYPVKRLSSSFIEKNDFRIKGKKKLDKIVHTLSK